MPHALYTMSGREDVTNAIRDVVYLRGSTNTAAALTYASDMMERVGQRSGTQRIAVILTDGGSNDKAATFA